MVQEDLRVLCDREEIKELRYEYFYRVDDRDWSGYASLFTEDGIADMGGDDPFGRMVGHDEIKDGIELIGNQFDFWAHWGWNPIIEVDGDEGTGRWYFGGPFTMRDTEYVDPMDAWILGTYYDEYRRVDGEWKFSKVIVDSEMVAPYKEGFSEAMLHGKWADRFY